MYCCLLCYMLCLYILAYKWCRWIEKQLTTSRCSMDCHFVFDDTHVTHIQALIVLISFIVLNFFTRYLKEFRTQQCPDFLQRRCTHHRPFACFNWHYLNQRRRRPVRKRDGTFNYSPDVYCIKYDETTGSCPEGDRSVASC